VYPSCSTVFAMAYLFPFDMGRSRESRQLNTERLYTVPLPWSTLPLGWSIMLPDRSIAWGNDEGFQV
jgi:hypothetical protein